LIEPQIKKSIKNDEKLLSKQTKHITGIQGCVLESNDKFNIDIEKAKLNTPFIKPKMTVSERKLIIENMRKAN
jgi:hypothetical protein